MEITGLLSRAVQNVTQTRSLTMQWQSTVMCVTGECNEKWLYMNVSLSTRHPYNCDKTLPPIMLMWKEREKNTLEQHPTLSCYRATTKSLCSPTRQLKFPKGFPRILNAALALALAWESAKSTVARGPIRVHLAKQPLRSWSTTGNVSRNGPSIWSCVSAITQNVCQSAFRHNKAVGKERNPCTGTEEKNNSDPFSFSVKRG